MISEPMSEELLNEIAPLLLPVRDMRAVACEVLGLTQDQFDAQCFTPSMFSDPIYQCLRLGMERKNIHSVHNLRMILVRASKHNAITTDAITYLGSLEHEDKQPSMHEITKTLSKFISPDQVQALFCGYFDLAIPEIERQQPQALDHRTVCVRILRLWGRLNPGCNSALQLVQALERAAQSTVDSCSEAKSTTSIQDEIVLDGTIETSSANVARESPEYGEILSNVNKKIDEFLQKNPLDAENVEPLHTGEFFSLKLKDRYIEDYHALSPLPWVSAMEASVLNDVFVTLYVDDEEQSTVISMNDMFTQHIIGSSDPAKLILLHGEAGSGKTTLTAKIALDWATGRTRINKLLEYSAVFVIRACLLEENDTFDTFVKREFLLKISESQKIDEALQSNSTLIIIDGYDEKRSTKDFITALISRKVMPDCTIMLTSRYGATKLVRQCFNFKVILRGFSHADIKSFVENYASHETKKNFLEMYAVNHPFINILSNPLYLWIFVLMGDEYFRDIQIFTRTDFYSKTLLGIREKAKQKLFANRDDQDIDRSIDNLCLLAYQCMKEDTLFITNVSTVDNTMAKLGILNSIISRSGIQDKTVHMFAHKTIMEFLAAKFIASTACLSAKPVIEHLLMLPEVSSESRRLASMVVIFTLGLLKSNHEAVIEVIKEIVPSNSISGKHADHLGLSYLCELDDTQWIPAELLEGRVNNELHLDKQCTPYCIRGLEKYIRIKTLENLVVNRYLSPPTSLINTQSCTVQGCPLSLLMLYTRALQDHCTVEAVYSDHVDNLYLQATQSDEPGVTVRISNVNMTSQQCSDVICDISRWGRLQEVVIENVKLQGNVKRTLSKISCDPPSISVLTVADHTKSSLVWVCWLWCSVSELVLKEVELSNDDIRHITATAHQQTAAPPKLKLQCLLKGGAGRLLRALSKTGYVHVVQELWVGLCDSDDDCAAVGHFLSQCTQICNLTWMRHRHWNSSVSVGALTNMWMQIATEVTHLHTVTVQEYAHNRRVDDVFFSVLRSNLTPKQSQSIRWRDVILLDNDKHVVTENECKEVYKLLPSVRAVWRGNMKGGVVHVAKRL